MTDVGPKVCVIGWPVGHSRSPLIHRYWLDKHRIKGTYDKREVAPEDLLAFLNSMAGQGFVGANVTVPHKGMAFQTATHIDPPAQRLKAVNTLYFRDKKLCGTNTDGEGFIAGLRQNVPEWQPDEGSAVVLGAGGAARAITGALLDEGVREVRIVNRTPSRAQQLASLFDGSIQVVQAGKTGAALADASLVVNTTTLGMAGHGEVELDLTAVPVDCVVSDIVYTPIETGFLKTARTLGLKTVDGLGMLLHQAVRGFELWFGVRPEVTADLRARILEDLSND